MPSNFTVKKKDIFVLFEKLLAKQRLTLIRRDDSNIVELIQGQEARFQRLPHLFDGVASEAEATDYVMRLRQIKHVDLEKMKGTIQPFLTQSGILLSYDLLRILIYKRYSWVFTFGTH